MISQRCLNEIDALIGCGIIPTGVTPKSVKYWAYARKIDFHYGNILFGELVRGRALDGLLIFPPLSVGKGMTITRPLRIRASHASGSAEIRWILDSFCFRFGDKPKAVSVASHLIPFHEDLYQSL